MYSHLKSLCCSFHLDPFFLVSRAIDIFKLLQKYDLEKQICIGLCYISCLRLNETLF